MCVCVPMPRALTTPPNAWLQSYLRPAPPRPNQTPIEPSKSKPGVFTTGEAQNEEDGVCYPAGVMVGIMVGGRADYDSNGCPSTYDQGAGGETMSGVLTLEWHASQPANTNNVSCPTMAPTMAPTSQGNSVNVHCVLLYVRAAPSCVCGVANQGNYARLRSHSPTQVAAPQPRTAPPSTR